jgi:serine/threonine protein phosphatase PrpC
MTATVGRTCVACRTPAGDDALFCEECGADLPPLAAGAGDAGGAPAGAGAATGGGPTAGGPTRTGTAATVPMRAVAAAVAAVAQPPARCPDPACGGPLDEDGYCTVCGSLAPRPRDHMVETPAPWVASVSDRGRRHHRNEDAAAVVADATPSSWAALVVCDGVSTSASSDVASLAAARAARAVLARERGAGLATGEALAALADARVVAAAAAAAKAVETATGQDPGHSPPSCTFVAALVDGPRVTVGSVGDSRAYWLPDAGTPTALTVDDSIAAEQIAAGRPREEAENGPQAHAITRWLGVDCDHQEPALSHLAVDGPGWLLLCSDGLWNYASEATALADLRARSVAEHGSEPSALAEALVRWANEQGGRDNITVALARLDVTTRGGEA